MATFTQVGIGTVRTRPCFPYKSTMHQRPSRCCTCAIVSAATSDRRKAQPRSTAMMARSRRPFSIVVSGALRSAWACFRESQLPARTPMNFALFTRWMPAANSGASSPLSVASTASLRMADMRTMMLDDPSPRSSRVTRHALTVALVKPGRGSWAYQQKNSSRAILYTRFVIGDETLSRTRDFIRRHSFVLSTTVNSFILHLLMGNIGSLTTLPLGGGDSKQNHPEPWAGRRFVASGGCYNPGNMPLQTLRTISRNKPVDFKYVDGEEIIVYSSDDDGRP